MKYMDFKIMVIHDESDKVLSLFSKKKNGLWNMQADRNYTHTENGGMQVWLWGMLAYLTIKIDDKAQKWAHLFIPSHDNDLIVFKVEDNEDKIDEFLDTDYYGHEID